MRKYRGKKRGKLLLLILLVLGISVGYALLSTNLSINGTAGINKNTWDIHWNENSVEETEGSVEAKTAANVSDQEKKNVTFAVDLELPGDFYEFTVDAKNYGTINGKIDNFVIKLYKGDGETEYDGSTPEKTLPDYIKYSFEYANGSPVENGDVLEAGQSKKYRFRIEYDKNATELPDDPVEIVPDVVIPEVQTKDEDNKPYTVTFNPNGGTVSMTKKEVPIGEKLGELPTAEKENSPFLGWYTDITDGRKITSDTMPFKDVTYYAHWANNYTKFDVGQNVNVKFKTLAENSGATYNTPVTNITAIERTNVEPDASNKTAEHIVSVEGVEPIYAWFDNGTIYWYTEATDVYLNEDASYMFNNISSVTTIDTSFNTINTTNMTGLFSNTGAVDLDLSKFDTSNVTTMQMMFAGTKATSLDLSRFNTSKVTNMSVMFAGTKMATLDLNKFDTSNVTTMDSMFAGSSVTSLDLSSFDINNVESLTFMFSGSSNLKTINISNWNFNKVTSLSNLFSGLNGLESIDFTNVNTSKITDMSNMFSNSSSISTLDLRSFDTSSVLNMSSMFYNMGSLTTIIVSDEFVVDQVTNSSSMFEDSTNIVGGNGTIYSASHIDKEYAHYDYGSTNPGYFNKADGSFYTITFNANGGNVSPITKTVYEGDSLGNLPVPTKEGYAFDGWYTLGGNSLKVNENYIPNSDMVLAANWNVVEAKFIEGTPTNVRFKILAGDNVSSGPSTSDTSITAILRSDVEPGNEHKAAINIVSTDDSGVPIYAWYDNGTIYWWSQANKVYLNEDASYMFAFFKSLTNIDIDFDTSLTTNMYELFAEDIALTELKLNSFNTSSVTNMSYMFAGDNNLTKIDVSSFDTSKVTDMSYMFGSNNSLIKLDLSNFNTSNVTNMKSMFYGLDSVTEVNMSNWDFRKYDYDNLIGTKIFSNTSQTLKKLILDNAKFGVNMQFCFAHMNYIEEISLKNVDTSMATSMADMFLDNYKLKSLDLSDFDTSNVTTMFEMFDSCGSLTTVNLDGFDTSKVTTVEYMFTGCRNLIELDLSGFDTSSISDMDYMFSNNDSLVSLDLSNWDFRTYNPDRLLTDRMDVPNTLKVLKMDNVKFPSDMDSAFNSLTSLERLSLQNADTSITTTMRGAFQYCKNIKALSLAYFDTHNVTDMAIMFVGMDELTTIFVSDDFVVNQVTDSENMFSNDLKLVGGNGTVYDANHIDKEYAHYDGGSSNPGYFQKGGDGRYTITLNANGGIVSPTSYDIYKGESLGNLPKPTKEGSVFKGWKLGSTDGIYVDSAYIPTSDITLVAEWRNPNIYTITLNANGGTVNPSTIQVTEENAIGEITDPIWNKHIFTGWTTEIGGGILVDEDYIPSSDMTIYANWLEVYTVTFNADGGSVSEASRDVIQYEKIGELPTAIKNGNYKFTGWYKTNNAKINYSFIPTSDITVSAKYEAVNTPDNFHDDDIDTITAVAQKGELCTVYNLGDTKEVDLGELGVHTIRIANCSQPQSCNSLIASKTGCGAVLEFTDIITLHYISGRATSRYNWTKTAPPKVGSRHLDARSYLNTIVYDSFPSGWKKNIIDTYVVSNTGMTEVDPAYFSRTANSVDKLYLLDAKEIYGSVENNNTTMERFLSKWGSASAIYNRQLDYYENLGVSTSNYSGAIKKYNGVNTQWWTRTVVNFPGATSDYAFFADKNGEVYLDSAYSEDIGFSPAFRIG